MLSALLIPAVLLAPAHAGKCDSYIRRADTSSGTALVQNFTNLARCDLSEAEANFTRFMTRATDADTLSALSLAAIDVEVWTPVWAMPGKIKSYEARDIVTDQIGASCAENAKVATFLQGGYAGLREVDFARWEDALVACQAEGFDAWVVSQIESPPAKAFDGKYDTMLKVFTERTAGAAALPTLHNAAVIAAGNGGPYDALINAMTNAVSPALGGDIAPADQEALSAALVAVANAVPAEKARKVAETLAASGNEAAAASLLPVVFSDRVQSGGGFMYGVTAVEAGECKGTQTAVVHFAELSEPGNRWIVTEEHATDIRTSKPRLKKCTPEGEWMLLVSVEPLADGAALREWVTEIESQWAGKGYEVSSRGENGINLD
ncbi:MAG: hypothetical protein ACI8S6_002421 [Myxococcota bacterium]|jgi:hypothetical protein